jgi:flagellar assembly protein FliH
MKNQLTNNQNGRFIKHNDPISKHMNIQDFNLMDVCEITIALADNPGANVFHHKLHQSQELNSSIHPLPDIDQIFEKERPPVIRPIDFTEDWKKMRRRIANRENRDDDEEVDLDLQSIISSYKTKKPAPEKSTESPLPLAPLEPAMEQPEAPARSHATILKTADLTQEKTEKNTPQPSPSSPHIEEKYSPGPPQESFTPYFPESDGMQEKHARLSEEELEALRQEARDQGFQTGWEEGSKQAHEDAKDKFGQIYHEMEKILLELQGMQKAILNKSQENFHAISQSMLEALLEREFRINPESFKNIIQRAIHDALPEDDYKITLNPTIAREIQTLGETSFINKIKTDEKLETFQFRIETKHGTVDARIKDIIQNLLDQADLNLFEEPNNDGKAS